jgi:hypothetical protein
MKGFGEVRHNPSSPSASLYRALEEIGDVRPKK